MVVLAKNLMMVTMEQSTVISTFYQFVPIEDVPALQSELLLLCQKQDMRGTILIAEEGINATISGSRDAIDHFHAHLRADDRFKDIIFKESTFHTHPFQRMKVRIKPEIVAIRDLSVNAKENAGPYIEPKDWDDFIQRDDVIVIDTRNHYEHFLGTFKGSILPATDTFRQFPEWAADHLKDNAKKIAMFCTGGVRCEKSTAYLIENGYPEVYHLKGGILGYFEQTGNPNKMWDGSCFVFDDRVAVDDQLQPVDTLMCSYCKHSMSTDDIKTLPDGAGKALVCEDCRT